MTEIKKNIPMPPFIKKGERQLKYPWREIEVGDCFDMPADQKNQTAAVGMANSAHSPKKFRRQKLEDGTSRIWRVE